MDKKNPKKLFSYINSRRAVISPISSMQNEFGSLTEDKKSIAEILNRHFNSVFVSEPKNQPIPSFNLRTNEKLSLIQVDPIIVENILKKLDSNKSIGVDGVHPHVLKECSDIWSTPLAIIFKKSLNSGQFPSPWLKANVTPLFKSGNPSIASNYRPISLTSISSKIMEKIVKKELMSFLEKHKLISKNQHGFVSKKACVTNPLETVDFTTKMLSMNKSVDVLFLDFAKAFDKVPHIRLIEKLSKYGIDGVVLNWIKHSYPTESNELF